MLLVSSINNFFSNSIRSVLKPKNKSYIDFDIFWNVILDILFNCFKDSNIFLNKVLKDFKLFIILL